MCKFLVGREDLGSRVIGYTVYESTSKEFIGMTEKLIVSALKRNEVINGFQLSQDGKLVLDTEGFFQTNYMIKSGINSYKAFNETDCPVNTLYTVVKIIKAKGKNAYETISSRHGRITVDEDKLFMLLHIGVISGGARMAKGKIETAKNVEVEALPDTVEAVKADTAKKVEDEKKAVDTVKKVNEDVKKAVV